MTTTETLDAPESLLADIERFPEATQRCLATQPTFGLLDAENAVWHGELDGRHVMTISGVLGSFDLDAARFEPVDPAPLERLLVERLVERHGAAAQPPDDPRYLINWGSAAILADAGGELRLAATAVPIADGPVADVVVTLDTAFEIVDVTLPPPPATAAPAPDPAADPAATPDAATDAADAGPTAGDGAAGAGDPAAGAGDPAAGGSIAERTGITAEYLGGYYGDTQFPVQRRWLVVDWASWTPDQATDDGRVGSWVTATTSLGGQFRAYGWFDATQGIVLDHAEELVAPDLGAELGRHYAATPFPFGDGHYVIDWNTWHAEPAPLDQPYGSWVGAAGHEGGRYQLYVRYDPGSGVEIVTAEELEAPPHREFEQAVVPAMRSQWERTERRLRAGDRQYDVSGTIDGESGCELRFVARDADGSWLATLGAVTVPADDSGESRPVTLELRITGPDDVAVLREDDRG